MFLVNSRQGHFTAAPSSSPREVDHSSGHPFSRSYGVILPSSLTRDHSSTLGFSPCLPVSVYGTVTQQTRIEAFLGSMVKASLRPLRDSPSPLGVMVARICLGNPPTGLDLHFQSQDGPHFYVTPWLRRLMSGTGIFACFPSPTPFGLSLGAD